MNRFLLTAILTAAWVFPCAAQTKEVVEEIDAKLATLRVAARHADERNEDVEILRRLLNKSLGLPDRTEVWTDRHENLGLAITAEGTLHAGTSIRKGVPPVGPLDGVYLKGAGVVYTLRVPAGADLTFDPKTQAVGVNAGCNLCHKDVTPHYHFSVTETRATAVGAAGESYCNKCHTSDVTAHAAAPLSEWEQTKLAVRGEAPKPPEPKKADKARKTLCDPGSLTELLTAQLFAHAKNVRHLGEKEAITLVVTFDELPGAMQSASSGQPVGKPGFTPEESQAFALGDLHLKQGKHTEAVEAYLKGLVRFQHPVGFSFPPNVPHKDATTAIQDMTASVRGTYKSLAAAYLQLGHLDDAKAALEKATSIQIESVSAKSAERLKPVGPAKLVLSVAKADLAAKDAAAFKKAVAVERLNFPAADEKKAK